MSSKTSPPAKKRSRFNRKNLSAWILSITLILLMTLRLVGGFIRHQLPAPAAADANAPAVATAAATRVLTEQDQAESALTAFFQLLADARYAEADSYYGGSYEPLIAANPQDAADHAALLKDACTVNGYRCLPVRAVMQGAAAGEGSFTFTVTFGGADGRLLTRPSGTGTGSISQFEIHVSRLGDRFVVLDLPVLLN